MSNYFFIRFSLENALFKSKIYRNYKTITNVKLDLKDYTLTRKNKNMKLRYHFDINEVTLGELEVTGMNTKMFLNVETRYIERKENMIRIEFLVEKEKFIYNLEVK